MEMFKKEVRHVGRLVSSDGVRIDLKDIEEIRSLKFKTPTTVGEVRKIMGFLSYFCSYVHDFS